jgi:hypothetical protein
MFKFKPVHGIAVVLAVWCSAAAPPPIPTGG